MKKDTRKTKVKFLIEQPKDDIPVNVFAFFPKELFSYDKDLFTCYAHMGQHSACHIEYAKECKEATKEEYKDLQTELESIGYNLTILNKN